jgi:lysozyme
VANRVITCIEDQLRLDEGERLSAYQDHLGYWTIGVGRLIDARKGGGISRAESALLLQHDIERVEAAIDRALPWATTLDPVRRGALVNMGFQMGVAGLLGFAQTLAAVKAGNYPAAADQMLASRWASQTPARARRLADQVRSGIWQ